MPELMSERGASRSCVRQWLSSSKYDYRVVIRTKLGHALNVFTVVREISIHVDRAGMLLDQHRQIIR